MSSKEFLELIIFLLVPVYSDCGGFLENLSTGSLLAIHYPKIFQDF